MNFGNVGNMWCCWLNFGALKLWKFCCVGLVEQIHDTCGKFVDVCKSYFMSMAKFCGYEYGKILWVWKNFAGSIHFFLWSWNFDSGNLLLIMRFWLWKYLCWVCDVGSWTTFVVMTLVMGNFCGCNFGHGEIFWLWFWTCKKKNLVVILDMEKTFLVVILDMKNFFGVVVILVMGKIFLVVVVMLIQTLFCRTSRADIAFKCWKAYGRYCLQIQRTLSMRPTFRLFSTLYWIRKPMSTRISNYSLLC